MLPETIHYFILKKIEEKQGKSLIIVCEYSGTQIPGETKWKIYPASSEIIIKNAEPLQKNLFRLSIKGVKKRNLLCGSCFFPAGSAPYFGRKFTGVLLKSNRKKDLKGKYLLHDKNGILKNKNSFIGEIKQSSHTAEVVLSSGLPVFVGKEYAISEVDNPRIIGDLITIYPGIIGKKDRKKIKPLLSGAINMDRVFSIPLIIDGYTKLPDSLRGRINPANSLVIGRWLIDRNFLENLRKNLELLSEQLGGIALKEAVKRVNIEKELLESLLKANFCDGIYYHEGYILNRKKGKKVMNASPAGKDIYQKIKETGSSGFDFRSEKNRFNLEIIHALERSGFITVLENKIAFDYENYKALVRNILNGKKEKQIAIQDIKSSTGLSRKYIIPLLDKMKKNGDDICHEQ